MARETGYMQQLVNYIKKNLSKGYTPDSLKFALENQGYSRTAITNAINIVNKELAEKAPILKEKPVIKYEIIKDDADEEKSEKKGFFKRFFGK